MTVSFFPRDLGLLLIFPVLGVTVVLPCLGGLSQSGLCTGLPRGWALGTPDTARVVSCLIFSPGNSAWVPALSPEWLLCRGEQWLAGADELGDSCFCFGVFCPMSLVGLMHGPPHISAMGGASRGLAGSGCPRQMGLRPWLGSKPCRYPSLSLYLRGRGGLSQMLGPLWPRVLRASHRLSWAHIRGPDRAHGQVPGPPLQLVTKV